MNLPNALTLFRIFLVPLITAVMLGIDQPVAWLEFGFPRELVALAIFLAASLTDLLDGYLARRWQQITTVGMLLDPIADKLLVSAVLIAMVQMRLVPAWIAIVVVGREFAVSGLRSIAASTGQTISASDLGKTKMAMQVIGIALLLMSVRWPTLREPALWWMYAVVVLTLWSAVDYFRKFWTRVDVNVKRGRRRELLRLERERAQARAAARRRAQA